VCLPDASVDEGFIGVCRRRLAICEPCALDAECGADRITYDDPRECKPFTVGEETASVCLPKKGPGNCPRGTIPADTGSYPELAGYCVPQSNDCASFER
jgi:hypothetical protein